MMPWVSAWLHGAGCGVSMRVHLSLPEPLTRVGWAVMVILSVLEPPGSHHEHVILIRSSSKKLEDAKRLWRPISS